MEVRQSRAENTIANNLGTHRRADKVCGKTNYERTDNSFRSIAVNSKKDQKN